MGAAYLLVSHGSRDPRPAVAISHLAKLVTQRLQATQPDAKPLVGTAVLELDEQPLYVQVQQFAAEAVQADHQAIKILPLFLLPGVHVMEDLPEQIELAQQQLHQSEPAVQLELCQHLGSNADLWQLLGPIDSEVDAIAARIVISHGSRRVESRQSVEAIAARLEALPAYWSIPPSLEDQVTALIQQGQQQIVILPYFLFEGGITDAIAQKVVDLNQQFPAAKLHLTSPIGATPQLADRIIELLNCRATEL